MYVLRRAIDSERFDEEGEDLDMLPSEEFSAAVENVASSFRDGHEQAKPW